MIRLGRVRIKGRDDKFAKSIIYNIKYIGFKDILGGGGEYF